MVSKVVLKKVQATRTPPIYGSQMDGASLFHEIVRRWWDSSYSSAIYFVLLASFFSARTRLYSAVAPAASTTNMATKVSVMMGLKPNTQ